MFEPIFNNEEFIGVIDLINEKEIIYSDKGLGIFPKMIFLKSTRKALFRAGGFDRGSLGL